MPVETQATCATLEKSLIIVFRSLPQAHLLSRKLGHPQMMVDNKSIKTLQNTQEAKPKNTEMSPKCNNLRLFEQSDLFASSVFKVFSQTYFNDLKFLIYFDSTGGDDEYQRKSRKGGDASD